MNTFDDAMKTAKEFANDMKMSFSDTLLDKEHKENFGSMNNLIALVWKCALMIEKYHFSVFHLKIGDLITFKGKDMMEWKDIYYPHLVKSHVIPDTTFFDPLERNPNTGVGLDGVFTRIEYINFRYQLYKYLYTNYVQLKMFESLLLSNPLYACLHNVSLMIAPYIEKYNHEKPIEVFAFNHNDMKVWKEYYFPMLVETGLLNDYSIADPIELRKNYGIGDDGVAFCWEFQYFVSEAYRKILLPIYLQFNCFSS